MKQIWLKNLWSSITSLKCQKLSKPMNPLWILTISSVNMCMKNSVIILAIFRKPGNLSGHLRKHRSSKTCSQIREIWPRWINRKWSRVWERRILGVRLWRLLVPRKLNSLLGLRSWRNLSPRSQQFSCTSTRIITPTSNQNSVKC